MFDLDESHDSGLSSSNIYLRILRRDRRTEFLVCRGDSCRLRNCQWPRRKQTSFPSARWTSDCRRSAIYCEGWCSKRLLWRKTFSFTFATRGDGTFVEPMSWTLTQLRFTSHP